MIGQERDDLPRVRWALSKAGFPGASNGPRGRRSGFRVTRNGSFCAVDWHTGEDVAPDLADQVRRDLEGEYRRVLVACGFEVTESGPLLARSPRERTAGRYRVGQRVTYRTRDGFWEHGAIVETDGKQLTLLIDRKQVSPDPKPIPGVPNDPGPMRDVEPPEERIVDTDDKRLSTTKEDG